ncbi:MAG: hypothetical protein LYZ70_07030 [Nitrososphaerales archaeon]|nr:hypothetical protein [Nitrososphaerales archaeon]
MPYEGWKTVAVRDEVYAKLKKKADKEHRSVTNMAEVIILDATEGKDEVILERPGKARGG